MTPEELLERHPRAALRFLRARLGLNQEALAREVGLGKGSVAEWEAGRRRIAPAHRARLARHQGAALRWLRGQLGLSQFALATRLGVGPGSVAAWEAGREALTPRYRRALAALLAPLLATPEGEAFGHSVGGGDQADRG